MVHPHYYERLSFGACFSRLAEIYMREWKVFLTLSSLILSPFIILMSIISAFLSKGLDFEEFDPEDPTGFWDAVKKHLPALAALIGIQTFLFVLMTVAGRGAMIRAVAEIYVGDQPEWRACLQFGASRFCALFCSGFVIFGAVAVMGLVPAAFYTVAFQTESAVLYFLTFVAYCAFSAGYFYIIIASILVFPAIVIENKSAVGGVKRALELAKNRWCELFCIFFCFGIVVNIGTRMLQVLLLGPGLAALFSASGVVVSYLPYILLLPACAILQTIVYLNLRICKEGMDASVLSGDILADESTAAYAALDLSDSGNEDTAYVAPDLSGGDDQAEESKVGEIV